MKQSHDVQPFALQLKSVRKALNLSQRKLAAKAHVNFSSISRLERGRQNYLRLDYGCIMRIADALHVEARDLFPLDEPTSRRRPGKLAPAMEHAI